MTADRVQVVLQWLEEVLNEHHRTADPREPLILPASLAERSRWMPLVEQVFKASEGVVVDALECRDGVDCGEIEADAPKLVALVRALLVDYNAHDDTAGLALQIADGRAEITGNPFDSVNAAQRAVREVAAAMCDSRLRDSDLAALVYAEESMDEESVAIVWRTLTDMLQHFEATSGPSTLCIVAGDSKALPDVNCSGPNSLRYRVDDQLSVRHAYANSLYPIGDVGRHAAQDLPLLVLFLGAGASVADGLQTGDRLRDRALESLTRKKVDKATFQDVARGWYAELESRGDLLDFERGPGAQEAFVDGLTLERVLEHEQQIEGRPYTTTLRAFAGEHGRRYDELVAQRLAGELADDPVSRLCARQSRIVIATVNFDQFIEARAGDDVEVFTTPDELETFPAALAAYKVSGGKVPLLKLHGSIENPDTLVATIRETNSGLNTQRQRAIQSLVSETVGEASTSWWYVGYSMRDRDLENIWKGADFHRMNEHWVDPYLNPYVARFIQTHRRPNWIREAFSSQWTARERLVSLTATDFLVELANVIDRDWT